MRTTRANQSHGFALIIVMIAVFVLAVLVGTFAFSMKVEMKLALNANRESDLIRLGRSGLERARWVLALQMSCPYDKLTQKWAGQSGGDCDTNGPLADVSLENFPVGDGSVTIRITDMERKININMANEKILSDALGVVGVDGSEIPGITSAILDWIDPDEATRINGAESEYYQTKDSPYYAKNKPMDELQELLLVRGVTPEMYWGSDSTNHSVAPFLRVDRFGRAVQEPRYPVGLAELFTPISSGQINGWTAPAPVVAVLFGGNQTAAEAFVQLRDAADNNGMRLEDLMRSAGLNNAEIPTVMRFMTQRSTTFAVEVDAKIGGYQRTFYGLLRRNSPQDVQILDFHWN